MTTTYSHRVETKGDWLNYATSEAEAFAIARQLTSSPKTTARVDEIAFGDSFITIAFATRSGFHIESLRRYL